MLSCLIKHYRQRQERQMYNKFFRFAKIGEMFETYRDADIFNESGNPENITIGHHTRVLGTLQCKMDAKIEIGNYSVIQNGVSVMSLEQVIIGNYTGIGSGSVICDNNTHSTDPLLWIAHRVRSAPGGKGYPGLGNGWELSESKPVIIKDGVWVGANCAILKGVVIGEGAIVARNSVVTKSVPPFSIVAGNPSRIIKERKAPVGFYEAISGNFLPVESV